jgi:hypothetical protein
MPKLLKVYPNPYIFVDGEGRLAGACPTHAVEGGHTPGQRRFVGASLDAKITKQGDPTKLEAHEQDTTAAYLTDPIEVPDTPDFYYRQRIAHVELVIADSETAKAIGRPFEDPARVLGRARLEAIARFKAEHDGEAPSFANEPCPVLGKAVDEAIAKMADEAKEAAAQAEADSKAASEAAEKAKKDAEAKAKADAAAKAKAAAPAGGE